MTYFIRLILMTYHCYSGKSFATPKVTKQPTGLLQYGSSVTLTCSVRESYNDYEMLWFKVGSDGKSDIKLRSTTRSTWARDYMNKVQREVLSIDNFREENEKYFCQVRRYAVKYIGRQNVELQLEGKR